MANRILFDASIPEKNYLLRVEENPDGRRYVRVYDSIAVGIHDPETDSLGLVVQSRPTAVNQSNPQGLLTEVVAGRFDRKLSPVELAMAEIEEEFGVRVRAGQIEMLNFGEPLHLS